MPLTLSASSFKYGDPDVTVANSSSYALPTWETQSGVVTNITSNSAKIVPENKTVDNVITVYSSTVFSGAHSPVQSFSGLDKIYWSEAGFNTSASEKVVGFSESTNGSKTCVWVCKDNVATCMVQGVAIGGAVHVNGDRFRVKLIRGRQAIFFKNFEKIAEHWFYPEFSTGYAALIVSGDTPITPSYYLNSSPRSTATLRSYAVFPTQPNYPYEFNTDENSSSILAEDLSPVTLRKPGKDSLSLPFNYRSFAEYTELKTFWDHHTRSLPFYFEDLVFNTTQLMKFDSGLKVTVQKATQYTINASLRAASSDKLLDPPLNLEFDVSLTNPPAGTIVTGNLSFSADVENNGTTKTISRVDYYVGSEIVGSSTLNNYSLTIDSNQIPNGTYRITARAIDNTGKYFASSGVIVTINNSSVFTPSPPVLIPDDILNILKAEHATLPLTEILFSTAGGEFLQYTTPIVVGNKFRAEGYWKFKIKSAEGRSESQIVLSPEFTVGTTQQENSAPSASNVVILGTQQVGQRLTFTYRHVDKDNDPKGTPVIQWYRATQSNGSDAVAIPGAVSLNYDLSTDDLGKYVLVGVKPTATKGILQGEEVKSLPTPVITVTVENQVPTVSNPGFTGSIGVGNLLTGTYNYLDAENNADLSTYRWLKSSSSSGTNPTVVATTKTYTVVSGDSGSYLAFEVTAKDAGGIGNTVITSFSLVPVVTGTPPTLGTVIPANGNISGTVVVSATVSAGSAAIRGVRFVLDGTLIGSEITVTSGGKYSTSFDSSSFTPGSSHTLVVTAYDVNGLPSSNVTRTLTAVSTTFAISLGTPLPSGVVGNSYGPLVITTTGGSGTVTGHNATLPAGLSIELNSGQARIIGTPTTAVTNYAFSINLTDSNGAQASKDFTITITATAVPTVNLSLTSNGSEAGQTLITATVTASTAVSEAQTVNFSLVSGASAADFTSLPTTITIPNGQTVGTATFSIIDDALVEGTEIGTFQISSPSSGITLGSTVSRTLSITDNESQPTGLGNLSVNSDGNLETDASGNLVTT